MGVPIFTMVPGLLVLYNVLYTVSSMDPILPGCGTNANYLDQGKDTDLWMAGIFPMAGEWPGGEGCRPSAWMGLHDVNMRSDILPGYHLRMSENDSMCEPGRGTNIMYELLYNEPRKVILLGPGCSEVSTAIAEAAKMWNLLMVSYGSSSPVLSNKERFPTFFRTHPSGLLHNPTRIFLFKKYNWAKIALLINIKEIFTSTGDDLNTLTLSEDISITTRQLFQDDPKSNIANLLNLDARIIVGLFYESVARKVFCEAYHQGLYGPKYVWFILGWFPDNWYRDEVKLREEGVNCTTDEMTLAVEGHITTEIQMLDVQDNSPTYSGLRPLEYKARLLDCIAKREQSSGFPEAPLAYDAVWAIALALNKTMNIMHSRGLDFSDWTYDNDEIHNVTKEALAVTDFRGVSGQVKFTEEGDRLANTQIEQLINNEYHILGYYDKSTDTYIEKTPPFWQNRIPQDSAVIKYKLKIIDGILFISMCLLAGIATVIAVACIVFNIMYWQNRMIQMSQPGMNNTTLVGCILCLACVYTLGLDGNYVSVDLYPVMCQLNAGMLSLGFTVAYGSMFAKIWCIHRSTTAKKKEPIPAWKLYSVVIFLAVIDIVYLICWAILSPMRHTQREFTRITREDIETIPVLYQCDCDNFYIWLGILYGMKGVLLLLGIFLAYDTRNIRLKDINDSRYVGMSIYNVVVLCCITAPVVLLINSEQNPTYAFKSLTILVCTILTMALIFLPKVMAIRKNNGFIESNELTGPSPPSKEEEERHKFLVTDNEQIKKQLHQKDEEISDLQSRLDACLLTLQHSDSPPSQTYVPIPLSRAPPIASAENSMITSPSFTLVARNLHFDDEEFSETYI